MNINFKKLLVPFSNDTKSIDAVQMWEVRWTSRCGSYVVNTRPELECFASEEEARAFSTSLENAFRLVHHTGKETNVYVTKAK